MITAIICAFAAGGLIALSRQMNGNLSVSTTALVASFWNHLVGFLALTILVFIGGSNFGWGQSSGLADVPPHVYIGGALGVIFVASGSWLLRKIGAAKTALFVIGGQMIVGIVIQVFQGLDISYLASAIGIGAILCGTALAQQV